MAGDMGELIAAMKDYDRQQRLKCLYLRRMTCAANRPRDTSHKTREMR